jgi:hypothetical protein
MKTTSYFTKSVLPRRPYLKIPESGKYLRVVTESDGETVHNAFFDRGFKL